MFSVLYCLTTALTVGKGRKPVVFSCMLRIYKSLDLVKTVQPWRYKMKHNVFLILAVESAEKTHLETVLQQRLSDRLACSEKRRSKHRGSGCFKACQVERVG